MNLQQRLQQAKTRKNLLKKREDRIKNKVKNIEREKVNLDSTHIKTGKIEKMKIIAKKKYKTHVDKGRKVEVKIQDNANPGTYVSQSSEYLTILERTKKYIDFDTQKLNKGCKAILSYAKSKRQIIITIQLQLKNPIQCNQYPTLLKLPQQKQITQHKAIIVCTNTQQLSKILPSESNIKVLTPKQFIQKYKKDKQFKKQIMKKLCRIFCQFKFFKSSKILKKLLNSNFPVFPIDTKKVPHTLQSEYNSYAQYILHLQRSCFAVVKSGLQHRIKLKIEDDDSQSLQNKIQQVTYQMVARLIYRNKNKIQGGNKLLKAKIKTQTSIPIDIYDAEQNSN